MNAKQIAAHLIEEFKNKGTEAGLREIRTILHEVSLLVDGRISNEEQGFEDKLGEMDSLLCDQLNAL